VLSADGGDAKVNLTVICSGVGNERRASLPQQVCACSSILEYGCDVSAAALMRRQAFSLRASRTPLLRNACALC
jgi:hypothetical protein